MGYDRSKPLIVQKDLTVLLETQHPSFESVRELLSQFADLIKSPQNIHTYRMTPLSLWNAAAAGIEYEQIANLLHANSKMDVPAQVYQEIGKIMGRYGLIRLESHEAGLRLVVAGSDTLQEIAQSEKLQAYLRRRLGSNAYLIDSGWRGIVKQELTRLGFPVIDLAGYEHAEPISVQLKETTSSGKPFKLRDYQQAAVNAFHNEEGNYGGSGLLVLPCGAGKTIIGIASMVRIGKACLILTTNVTSVRQWKREILDKTDLTEDQVGEYSGMHKQVRPVTIATYQILTHRKSKEEEFLHMNLFQERAWGLIIYDEVHLLPAPVFRATADIQATRRLGLTATLVREDGREKDVFSLVGPKRFEVPWKQLEASGWIAQVDCEEIRVPLDELTRSQYVRAAAREQHRIAGENPAKLDAIERILARHPDRAALVIGQYLDQLAAVAERFHAPIITGQTPHDERDELYRRFREGDVPVLVVSKVANFAVDLPDASLALQVSGSFGSRQEEAQRLGRILRPKPDDNRAYFYTIVSRDTREQDFSMKRQLFLLEQGYRYHIADMELERSGGVYGMQ